MKKMIKLRISLALLALLAAALFLGAAVGEPAGKQKKDVNQAQVWELEALINSGHPLGPDENVPNGGYPTPVIVTAPKLDNMGTWRINDNFYGRTLQRSTFAISMQEGISSDYTMIYYRNYTGTIYTFTGGPFVSGGAYRISIWYWFTNGSYGYNEYDFYLADDTAHTSVTEKVNQVVLACKAATPWQTALNLYDWLTHNVYYDQAQEFYGVDILVRGKGTSDAYSKAYYLLCRGAGIPVSRVTGTDDGAGHAWNAILIEGSWYYVDPCWDDPAGGTLPTSGKETHVYFCLNEDLMSLDHTNDKKLFSGLCVNLDANYYVRTGKWDEIGNLKFGAGYINRYSSDIATLINGGQGYGTVFCGSNYWVGTTSYQTTSAAAIRGWTLLAYGMSRDGLSTGTYGKVNVRVSYDRSAKAFNYAMTGFSAYSKGTLTLPKGLTGLTDEMLKGVPANILVVPASCKVAADTAIQGSLIHTIIFLGTDITINKAFFNGISPLLVLCPPGSPLETKLNTWGILHSIP